MRISHNSGQTAEVTRGKTEQAALHHGHGKAMTVRFGHASRCSFLWAARAAWITRASGGESHLELAPFKLSRNKCRLLRRSSLFLISESSRSGLLTLGAFCYSACDAAPKQTMRAPSPVSATWCGVLSPHSASVPPPPRGDDCDFCVFISAPRTDGSRFFYLAIDDYTTHLLLCW